MVSLFKAKKVYCGGKLILIDFSKLTKKDVENVINPNYMEIDLAVVNDGTVYINSNATMFDAELMLEGFKGAMSMVSERLDKIEKEVSEKYPDVTTMDELVELANATDDPKEKGKVFMCMVIPTERLRRTIASDFIAQKNQNNN